MVTVVFIQPSYGFLLFLRAVTLSKVKKMIVTAILRKKEDSTGSFPHRQVKCTPLINH